MILLEREEKDHLSEQEQYPAEEKDFEAKQYPLLKQFQLYPMPPYVLTYWIKFPVY